MLLLQAVALGVAAGELGAGDALEEGEAEGVWQGQGLGESVATALLAAADGELLCRPVGLALVLGQALRVLTPELAAGVPLLQWLAEAAAVAAVEEEALPELLLLGEAAGEAEGSPLPEGGALAVVEALAQGVEVPVAW